MEVMNEVLEQLKILTKEINSLKLDRKNNQTRSTEINELFSALAKAQTEMKIAGLDSDNPYFKSKYADLVAIVKASRPYLSKNGLSIIQQVMTNDDGSSVLNSILAHSSGQWIESRMRITPAKNDIQSIGSYISYLKRYSMAALVGCVAGDEDDDGEAAMYSSRELLAKGPAINVYKAKTQSPEVITREQFEELERELEHFPDLAEEVMDKLHLQSLADMPKTRYRASIDRIRELKFARSKVTT